MNTVILKGNLTKENELKYLPSGSAICSNSIATTKKWKDQQGQQKEKTCFIDIVVFGKGAEIFNQYTKKGSKIIIRGSIELDQWQDQQGQNRQKHKISVEEFEFLDSKQDNQQNQPYGVQQQGGYNHSGQGMNIPDNSQLNSQVPPPHLNNQPQGQQQQQFNENIDDIISF